MKDQGPTKQILNNWIVLATFGKPQGRKLQFALLYIIIVIIISYYGF